MERYYDLYRKDKNKISYFRYTMVNYALNESISKAAIKFQSSRKTVRKWVDRYRCSVESLEDRSKRPHSSSKQLSIMSQNKIKERCMDLKIHNKRIAASYIISDLELSISLPTVCKYMREFGFKQEKKSKREKKRNLQHIKEEYKAFEKIQVDIKYLDDIPEFYSEYYRYKLPKYQITARCIKTGSLFFCYAKEKTPLNTAVFIKKLLEHLKKHNINISEVVTIQTDNGREFKNLKGEKSTKFLDMLSYFEVKYKNIPAGAKTWQSDVESSHRLIEDEFYSYEIFKSRNEFFSKAYKYQYNFNINRKSKHRKSYKYNLTPLDILKKEMENTSIEEIKKIYDFDTFIADDYIETVVNF